MAKKLKGITVEIRGDTGPLSKALEDVNKTSRTLQVELRQVERLLKLDPTNTELLAQKQQILGQSISSTEEKLNALKAAQAQVQAQFEKGDIGEEQYREFQREIIKTENELKKISTELDSTNNHIHTLSQAGEKGFNQFANSIEECDASLIDINKTSKTLQDELIQIEKLLKLDPTNTELLTQKQKLLSDSIKNTEDKLKQLKDTQSKVESEFANGNIGEDKYREFQREIIKTEQELNNIKNAYQVATRNLEEFGDNNGVAKEEAEKLSRAIEEQNRALAEEKEALKRAQQEQKEHEKAVKKASEEIEKQKEKIKDAAKTIGAGIAAAGAATATSAGYAVKLSDEFDKAFNTLITRTGASKDEFDSLNTSMENIYKNGLGESIEDVAQSMATVKTNTNLAGEELEKATERALLLRDTFEFDINESTRSAQMLMKQFGLTSDEAYNLIAQGAQMGLDKNGDLLDTINEYSVHFGQAGYSAEEMFNSLKNGVDAGTFSVDKLGDAVKEFGVRMKDGSADEALKSIGLNVDDVTSRFAKGGETASIAMGEIVEALFSIKDPLKQNEVGVALFGTMWEDLGAEGVNALMNIHGEADRASSTLEEINNKKYDNIGHAIEELGRTINVDVVQPIGKELQPAVEEAISYVQDNAPTIKDILSEIADTIGDFISFIVDNGPTIAGIVSGLATSFMVLKGALVAGEILKFVSGLKTMEGGFKLANVAAALFNGTLLSNPMTWIVAIIAGLVAAIITFIATNEDLRKSISEAWQLIKESASECWGAICDFFTVTIPEAWGQVEQLFADAGQWFSDVWSDVKNTTSEIWDNIVNYFKELPGNITNTFNDLKEQAINKWDEIKEYIGLKVEEIITNTVTFFEELPYKIGFALGTLLANIVNWGVETYNYFTTNVPIWIESISTWFSELPGKIWTWLSNSIQKIVDWGTQTYNNAKNYASNTLNSIVNYFSQLPGRIWTWLSNSVQKIVDWGTQTYNKAKTYASNTLNGIITYFSQLPGKMWTWLSNSVQKIVQMGTEMMSKGKTAASNTVTSIVNGFKSLPDKLVNIGKSAVEGIWKGISNSASWINDKISKFCGGIVDGFKSALKINSPSKIMRDKIGVGIVEGIDVGMDKEMPNLNKGIKSNINNMVSSMRAIIDTTTPNVPAGIMQSLSNNIDNSSNASFTIDYEKLSYAFIDAIKKTNLDNPRFEMDGRDFARKIAPYQDEFENYACRKPRL